MSNPLETALGQCFWTGINGTTVTDVETQAIFKRFTPGGIILFQRNVENANQVIRLNRDLQSLSKVPLLMAIDQEGGTVERLHHVIGTIPPAMALSATRKKSLIREVHLAHARLLRALGFNVNFNPVLDLALQNSDNGLGTRCYGSSSKTVIQCAAEVIAAHEKAGVLVCGKHFPGLGDTDLDSHMALPVVSRKWKTIEKEDLAPYRQLIDRLPFIMINHALYPEKDKKAPASLSRTIVEKFLLHKWSYEGFSISDDLIMGAVSNMYNLTEASERALLAGNHLFLICKPEGVVDAFEKLLKRAKSNEKLRNAIFENSSRILAFKFTELSEEPDAKSISHETKRLHKYSERAAELSITLLQGTPLQNMPESFTVYAPRTKWISSETTGLSEYLTSRGCRVKNHLYAINMDETVAREAARKSETEWNTVITVNSAIHPGQNKLIHELLHQNKRVAVISGGYPMESFPPNVQMAVAAYCTSPMALRAAGMALLGERKCRGTIPI